MWSSEARGRQQQTKQEESLIPGGRGGRGGGGAEFHPKFLDCSPHRLLLNLRPFNQDKPHLSSVVATLFHSGSYSSIHIFQILDYTFNSAEVDAFRPITYVF